jgi:hypothetical protein
MGMKRRTVILAGIAATAAIAIPLMKYRSDCISTNDPLMRPTVLTNFCDEKTIREIGDRYRMQVPEENKEEKLRELLLSDEKKTKKIGIPDDETISDLLNKKVNDEFKEGDIVIEDGWILSKTEARQCALFSLAENK